MENDLHFNSGLSIQFIPGLPTGYAGAIMPGSAIRSACGDFGYLVRQEITTRQYSIRYQVFRFFERMQLSGLTDPAGLLINLALRQAMVRQIARRGKMRVKENHFVLVYGQQVQTVSTFAPGKEYQSVDIAYAPEMINELLPVFPELYRFLQRATGENNAGMPGASRRATEAMLQIIQTIIGSSYEREQEKDFLNNRVKDYLVMSIDQAQGNVGQALTMGSEEKEAIDKARQLIEQDITQHWSTVSLAKEVKMNEYTFKMLFRQITGVGTFEYLLQQRLNRAYNLLVTTDLPIKVIHVQVGYDSLTGFITGFKKYFGCTPGSLRR